MGEGRGGTWAGDGVAAIRGPRGLPPRTETPREEEKEKEEDSPHGDTFIQKLCPVAQSTED